MAECYICGYKVRLEKHHIIPLSDNGCECDNNIVILCPNHHGLVTYPDKDKRRSTQVIKSMPKGMRMDECDNCSGKYHASKRVLKILMKLDESTEDERKKLIFEMLDLQLEYGFDVRYILKRHLGYSEQTLDKLQNYVDEDEKKNELVLEWAKSRGIPTGEGERDANEGDQRG